MMKQTDSLKVLRWMLATAILSSVAASLIFISAMLAVANYDHTRLSLLVIPVVCAIFMSGCALFQWVLYFKKYIDAKLDPKLPDSSLPVDDDEVGEA